MASNVHDFSEYAEAFELGLTEVYVDELTKLPKEYYPWLREYPAQHFFDTDWVLSGVGVMPTKDIGAEIITDKILRGPTKRHGMQPYALALVIQYEVIRWDLYSIFEPVVRELAKSAVDRYNLIAYKLLNEHTTTTDSNYLTYQGEVPVTQTHTRLDGGSWSNRLANDEGVSYEGFQKAIILLRKLVNERGRFVRVVPDKVIVPVDTKWIALTILDSVGRSGTADNDVNTMYGYFGCTDSVYLSEPTFWWMQCSKNDRAFRVAMRLGDNPDIVRDQDPRTRNRFFSSYCSMEMGTFDTRGIVGSTGGA